MTKMKLFILFNNLKHRFKFYFIASLILTLLIYYTDFALILLILVSFIAVLFIFWTRNQTQMKAQYIIFESYSNRMSQILMKEKCYPKHKRKSLELTSFVIDFILTDTVDILEQLQGNYHFQNYALNYLRSFGIQNEPLKLQLSHLNLKYLNWNGFSFKSTIFHRYNLENAIFETAYFRDCDLSYSNLTNANFAYTKLVNTNLSCANLKNADFEEARLFSTNFSDANLTNANFKAVTLHNVNLDNAKMYGVKDLTVEQVLQTYNWKTAYFDIHFKQELQEYFSKNNEQ